METETLLALKKYPTGDIPYHKRPRLKLTCPLSEEHLNDTIGFFFNVSYLLPMHLSIQKLNLVSGHPLEPDEVP